MKLERFVIFAALFLLAAPVFVVEPAPSPTPTAAAVPALSWKVGEFTFKPILTDRLRVEMVDWCDPSPGLGDESYTFVAHVIRFGGSVQWRMLQATVEGQEAELWNVPSDAPGLGPGAAYYSYTAYGDQREVAVRRAVLQWNDAGMKGLSLSGGRYILNDGLETTAADASLQWIKKNRVSQRLGPGDIDGLLWVAGQTGQWESLDHSAWAIAAEGGYRPVDAAGKPWLRAGWFHGSGDSNPNDGNQRTFFQVLPTTRLYAQTPFFKLMNNEDLFVQAMVTPLAGMNLRADWHHLWTTEGEDLLYSGAGAAQSKPVFGFGGFSSRGHSSVGDLLDLSAEYAFHPNAKVTVYYGHVFGDSVLDAQFAGSGDANYGYLELTLSL